jgi:hypothetical protein
VICATTLDRKTRYAFRLFAHQREQVVFGIAKLNQPEIVCRHRRDEPWVPLEIDIAIPTFVRLIDLPDFEIKVEHG